MCFQRSTSAVNMIKILMKQIWMKEIGSVNDEFVERL
jgi:hypothetical protein